MKTYKYEKLLNIKTKEDRFTMLSYSENYYEYEATDYEALEQLLEHYEINSSDYVVDYGCGKGRLNFFLNYFTRAHVSGIEMDDSFIEDAIINKERYTKKYPKYANRIEFHACLAEEYRIKKEDNIFYFFNPFSVDIFRKVIYRILGSVAEFPRKVDVILFYPLKEYIFFLERQTPLQQIQEIPIDGFYEKDEDERFLIYRWNG